MRIFQLTDTLSVAEQIAASEVEQIAAAGFQVLVNNRPDGEAPGQPSSSDIAAAARAAGLEYHYLPVTAADFPGPRFEETARLLNDPNRRVLAFCRSGTRCANLWIASRDGDARQQARSTAAQLGFDLSMSARCP
jgi:uncharacterized protein (TIGR01244 family)